MQTWERGPPSELAEISNSKTGKFALFQKKNVSEEVFTDMVSSLASLYNDKDTPPIHYD